MRQEYPGRVIKERYRLIRSLATGDEDFLYFGEDLLLGKTVTVRIIPYKFTDAESVREGETMFKNQLDVLCRLDHPGLPQVMDGFIEKTEMFIITEFTEGEPLEQRIQKKVKIDQEAILEWSQEILKILDYLHSRYPPVIFRDLKPANILLRKNGTIQLMNFGLARTYKPFKTQDTLIRGSKGYAAPEQAGGKGQTDPRADIYSFGVTIHRLLTGFDPSKSPFHLPPLKDFRPDIPEGWQTIISKATDLKPENRYKSVGVILKALENMAQGKPLEPEPEPVPLPEKEPEPPQEPSPEPVASSEVSSMPEEKQSLGSTLEDYDILQAKKKKMFVKIGGVIAILVALILAGTIVFRAFSNNIAIGIIIFGICALFAGAAAYFFLFKEDFSPGRF